MKILETERLYLREFEECDLDKIAEIYSDDEVMKYIGRGGAADKSQTQRMFEAFKKSHADNGFGLWALIDKETDSIIGHCGFNILHDKSDIEIAYLIAKEFWGKGFATEISKATLEFGFKNLNLKRIVALAYPENTASVNVIRKLEMKPEGEKEFFGKNFLFFSIER